MPKEPNAASRVALAALQGSAATTVERLETALRHFKAMSVAAYDADLGGVDLHRSHACAELHLVRPELDRQETIIKSIGELDPELFRETALQNERDLLARMPLAQVRAKAFLHALACGDGSTCEVHKLIAARLKELNS